MPLIELSTEIRAPIEIVFDLSRSIDLHVISTADTGERPVGGVMTGLIELGQEVTWRARHFGIWQRLTSRITAFDPPDHFRDSLVRGPFKHFDHDHFFSARGENTIMRDVFKYESPWGVLGRIADALFLSSYMRRLLLKRNEVIKRTAETDEWRHYIQPA